MPRSGRDNLQFPRQRNKSHTISEEGYRGHIRPALGLALMMHLLYGQTDLDDIISNNGWWDHAPLFCDRWCCVVSVACLYNQWQCYQLLVTDPRWGPLVHMPPLPVLVTPGIDINTDSCSTIITKPGISLVTGLKTRSLIGWQGRRTSDYIQHVPLQSNTLQIWGESMEIGINNFLSRIFIINSFWLTQKQGKDSVTQERIRYIYQVTKHFFEH